MNTLLIGSIGALVETSEIQRDAFNQAFARFGLRWQWGRDEYQKMLQVSGGRQRIESFAKRQGESVDASAIHRTKSDIFQQTLASGSVQPRPGVRESLELARRLNCKIGLVTTTSSENVDAILAGIKRAVPREWFDVIVNIDLCEESKPAPACYAQATSLLQVSPADCMAVEDNVDGVQAAVAAGVYCVAYPGQNTRSHDFSAADEQTDDLFQIVRGLLQPRTVSV